MAPETRKLRGEPYNFLIVFILWRAAPLHPMQVRYQAALRPEIYQMIIAGPLADTLFAQDIEQALDFPT